MTLALESALGALATHKIVMASASNNAFAILAALEYATNDFSDGDTIFYRITEAGERRFQDIRKTHYAHGNSQGTVC